MEGWSNFFMAETGAAAALIGLLFVAISINLPRILEHAHLPGRAAEALTMLVGALIICSLTLLPGQPRPALGAEILVIGLAVLLYPVFSRSWVVWNEEGAPMPSLLTRLALTFLPAAPLPLGGLALALGQPWGLYLVAVGVLMAFVSAVINCWVLLVEILR